MKNKSLSNHLKEKIDPNVERLSLVVSKLLEKELKENYDFESKLPEDFSFPLILKEYTIDYNK